MLLPRLEFHCWRYGFVRQHEKETVGAGKSGITGSGRIVGRTGTFKRNPADRGAYVKASEIAESDAFREFTRNNLPNSGLNKHIPFWERI